MCGGGKKAPPPATPAPIPENPNNTADRGNQDAALRPAAAATTATTGLGGEATGTGTTSVLGG